MAQLTINEKIERFRLYCAHYARMAGRDVNKRYDTSDLRAAQERAIRQLQEYLDPVCDDYLLALVNDGADRELEERVKDE